MNLYTNIQVIIRHITQDNYSSYSHYIHSDSFNQSFAKYEYESNTQYSSNVNYQ